MRSEIRHFVKGSWLIKRFRDQLVTVSVLGGRMKFKPAKVGEEVVIDSYFVSLDYCGIPIKVLKVTNPQDPSAKLDLEVRGKRLTVYNWQVASLKHEPERAQDAIRRRRLRSFHERKNK